MKDELNNQEIINVLINRRLLLGMNQTQLAEKMGVKRQVVNRWEKGHVVPNSINLIKACKVLGLNIYDFFA